MNGIGEQGEAFIVGVGVSAFVWMSVWILTKPIGLRASADSFDQ